MNPKRLIRRYRKLLTDIKADFRVLYDAHWSNEFRPCYSSQFTHVWCNRCEELRLRDDPKSIDCFMNHVSIVNLERYDTKSTQLI